MENVKKKVKNTKAFNIKAEHLCNIKAFYIRFKLVDMLNMIIDNTWLSEASVSELGKNIWIHVSEVKSLNFTKVNMKR